MTIRWKGSVHLNHNKWPSRAAGTGIIARGKYLNYNSQTSHLQSERVRGIMLSDKVTCALTQLFIWFTNSPKKKMLETWWELLRKALQVLQVRPLLASGLSHSWLSTNIQGMCVWGHFDPEIAWFYLTDKYQGTKPCGWLRPLHHFIAKKVAMGL